MVLLDAPSTRPHALRCAPFSGDPRWLASPAHAQARARIALDLCDEGDEARAEILKRFQQITTTGEAKAYMQAKGERIAAVRRT
mgnify:CR=1 FL=1